MTVSATFHPVQGADWSWRIVITGELRAISGGHEDHIQRLVNSFDAHGEGPELQLHHACRRLGWNIVVGFHDSGEHVISGRVPPAPPFHRGRARHVHQPWSNVVLLAHGCSSYTLAHEIGHVLGLGEGYRDYLRYVERNGHQIAADVDRRTIPGAAGTPMASSGDAGRDPNADQLNAIVTYCLRAKAEITADRAFGPEVDGYRARIMR